MIQFKCSCCGQLLQLGDEWAGKVAKCPYSGQFMQVPSPLTAAAPLAPPPKLVRTPAPPPAPAPARQIHNPFGAGPFVAPATSSRARSAGAAGPEFGHMAGTAASDAQQQIAAKSLQVRWQARGTLLGAAGGVALGLLFGLLSALLSSGPGGERLLALLSILCGGAVLGAGIGGILGPALLVGRKGLKLRSTESIIRGALYGTARVAGFGALGSVLPGGLRGMFTLLTDGSKVGEAVLGAILTTLLLALAWAAIGAFLGAVFGAAAGAVGGYEAP